MSKGTIEEWESHTPKSIPEKKGRKKSAGYDDLYPETERRRDSTFTVGDLGNVIGTVFGRSPLRSTLTGAALGGTAGYFLLPAVLQRAYPKIFMHPRGRKLLRLASTTLGAGLGSLPWITWLLADLKTRGIGKRAGFSEDVYGGSMFSQDTYPTVAVGTALNTIRADRYINRMNKIDLSSMIVNANQGKRRGLVSVGDLTRGALGAGLGYGAANLAGSVMGTIFGLPATAQRRLSQVGAIAGALKGVGLLE